MILESSGMSRCEWTFSNTLTSIRTILSEIDLWHGDGVSVCRVLSVYWYRIIRRCIKWTRTHLYTYTLHTGHTNAAVWFFTGNHTNCCEKRWFRGSFNWTNNSIPVRRMNAYKHTQIHIHIYTFTFHLSFDIKWTNTTTCIDKPLTCREHETMYTLSLVYLHFEAVMDFLFVNTFSRR